ncbi:MAG: cysteine desulfurase NifS [Verrucomicrobiales bacterium]|nr:cysteine desulfurase NifS [Verrucomicrobiales bacterium]
MRTIYLDYNATTPLDESVKEAMLPYLGEIYGNPSSVHHVGQRARAALDDARERCANVLRCKPSEIIFTSGATESCNQAIMCGAWLGREKGRHLVTSAIEHHAVLHACEYLANNAGYELSVIPPDSTGRVPAEAICEAIRPDTALVSLMAANNEVGTLQPVSEVGEVCANNGTLFHTDAVQAFGKLPFSGMDQFNADFVSLCSHKLHGPKGAGVLFSRSPLQLPPLIHGGTHENERRAGTENVPAIIGLTSALEHFVSAPVFPAHKLSPLFEQLKIVVDRSEFASFRGNSCFSLPNTIAFSLKGTDSIAALSAFDLEGFCVSSGSACSSGSVSPSHVLAAMGVDSSEANALIRVSMGRETTKEEIVAFADAFPRVLNQICRPTTSPTACE